MDKPAMMSAILRKQSNDLQICMYKSIYYNIYYILETMWVPNTWG